MLPPNPTVGLTVLRVAIGAISWSHGFSKLFPRLAGDARDRGPRPAPAAEVTVWL
jgi:hypothetical protein